jgi:hypothetical protein
MLPEMPKTRHRPQRNLGFHAQTRRFLIERAGVAGAVAGQPLQKGAYESRGEEGNLMKRSRSGTSGERTTSAVCHCHEFRTRAPLGLSDAAAPLLAR